MEIPGFDIRYTYVTDISYLREWVNHPTILKWFPMATEKEVEDALQCWIGFCRWSSSLTATIDRIPCAVGTLFLMPYQKVAHQALFKLAVNPKWQRRGIGTALLRNLKHLAKNYFHLEAIAIEIFEGNPIESLLKQQGFQEIFRQNHYVKDPDSARIYMEAYL